VVLSSGQQLLQSTWRLYDIADKAWEVYCGDTIFRTPEEAKAEAHRSISIGYAGIKGNPLEDRT
jgi:hypothetical protein